MTAEPHAVLLDRMRSIPGVVILDVAFPFEQEEIPSPQTAKLFGLGGDDDPSSFEAYVDQFVHPEDQTEVLKRTAAALTEAAPFDFEYRIIHRDGDVRHIHSVGLPIQDATGQTRRLLSAVVDVTAQKKELKVRASERAVAFAHNVLGVVPAALLVLDQELRVVSANQRLVDALGTDEAAIVGLPIGALGSRQLDLPGLLEALPPLFSGNTRVVNFETQVQTDTGPRIATFFATLLDQAEQLIGSPAVLLSIGDVTDERRAQQILREHKESLEAEVTARTRELREVNDELVARAGRQQALAELGAVALRANLVPTVDEAMRTLRRVLEADLVEIVRLDAVANKVRLHAGLGWPPGVVGNAEADGDAWAVLDRFESGEPAGTLATHAVTSLERMLPWAAAAGAQSTLAVPIAAVDGLWGALCVHATRARAFSEEEANFLRSVAHIIAEVVARTAIVAQLRHADRLATVGRLTAGVAHELGTPVNVVSAHARMILRGQVHGNKINESAQAIDEQAQRMTGLVRELMDYARARRPEDGVADVGALIERTVAVLVPMARKRRVTLHVDRGPNRVSTSKSSQELQQIVTNLVVNGVDAQPGGGRVAVAVHPAAVDNRFVIAVADSGPGIPELVQEKMFDPFFTTKPPGEGTGLGLSVTLGLVREWGGDLNMTSSERDGTRFEVVLPGKVEGEQAR